MTVYSKLNYIRGHHEREKSKISQRERRAAKTQWIRWEDKIYEGIWKVLERGYVVMAHDTVIRVILFNKEIKHFY